MGKKSRFKVERKAADMLQAALRATPIQNGNGDQIGLTIQRTQIHSGPIPSADEFARYEHILPGAADRILRMAETQSVHRQSIETKEQARLERITVAESKKVLRGQLFGFALVMTGVGGGVFLLLKGYEIGALAALVLALSGIAGPLIVGRYKKESSPAIKD